MALINCPECGKQISNHAKECIHCGYPIERVPRYSSALSSESRCKGAVEVETYDVIFNSFSEKDNFVDRNRFIDKIIAVRGFDRTAAKNFIDNPPQTIASGISLENAKWLDNYFLICNVDIDVIKVNKEYNKQFEKRMQVVKEEERRKQDAWRINREETVRQADAVLCPRCRSAAITTGQRGYSLVWGFWGSNRTMNRCAKCGHKWMP